MDARGVGFGVADGVVAWQQLACDGTAGPFLVCDALRVPRRLSAVPTIVVALGTLSR